jgi:hypothetical protein
MPIEAAALLRPPSKRRLEDLVRRLQLTPPHATAAALAGTLAAPSHIEAALAELCVAELELLCATHDLEPQSSRARSVPAVGARLHFCATSRATASASAPR